MKVYKKEDLEGLQFKVSHNNFIFTINNVTEYSAYINWYNSGNKKSNYDIKDILNHLNISKNWKPIEKKNQEQLIKIII